MTEPPLTWEDVNWLRKEAAREERHVARYKSRGLEYVEANMKRAIRLRSLADRIERELKKAAA